MQVLRIKRELSYQNQSHDANKFYNLQRQNMSRSKGKHKVKYC